MMARFLSTSPSLGSPRILSLETHRGKSWSEGSLSWKHIITAQPRDARVWNHSVFSFPPNDIIDTSLLSPACSRWRERSSIGPALSLWPFKVLHTSTLPGGNFHVWPTTPLDFSAADAVGNFLILSAFHAFWTPWLSGCNNFLNIIHCSIRYFRARLKCFVQKFEIRTEVWKKLVGSFVPTGSWLVTISLGPAPDGPGISKVATEGESGFTKK